MASRNSRAAIRFFIEPRRQPLRLRHSRCRQRQMPPFSRGCFRHFRAKPPPDFHCFGADAEPPLLFALFSRLISSLHFSFRRQPKIFATPPQTDTPPSSSGFSAAASDTVFVLFRFHAARLRHYMVPIFTAGIFFHCARDIYFITGSSFDFQPSVRHFFTPLSAIRDFRHCRHFRRQRQQEKEVQRKRQQECTSMVTVSPAYPLSGT